ncbi:MAG: transporter substrate-binding domain-containing protein [Candidatus Thorarchaeota archaeon]|nr:transporter substrate-binding domain-containing protein [Candidatus Thorarchaeota archaeon]
MILALSVMFMPPVHAQNKTWIVGIDKYYPPHEYWENGSAQGFNADVIRAVASKMGRTIQWIPLTWNEAPTALENGTVESLCMSVTEEREDLFDFSTPILNLTLRVFVRTDVTGIFSIEDLAGHTVAVEQNDVAQKILETRVPNATIVPVDTQEDAILLMAKGEVTAAFCNEYAGVYAIVSNNMSNIKKIGAPVSIGPRSIAVAKGNTALLSEINQGIEQIFESGEYGEIRERWFGTEILVETRSAEVVRNAAILLGIVSAIAIILVVWNWTLQSRIGSVTEKLTLLVDLFKHDLRNIDQTLVGGLQLLEYEGELSSSGKEMLAIALNSIDRSQRLTNDFLTIEALTTGRITIQPMKLSAVLNEAIRRANGQDAKIDAVYNHSEDLYIRGCEPLPDALSRLLIYIANIEGTTKSHNPIGIVTKEQRSTAHLFIECTKCSIPVQTHEAFLLRYHGAKQVGVGLGLSLLHATLVACDGDIRVTQKTGYKEDTSTIFHIKFKKAAPSSR